MAVIRFDVFNGQVPRLDPHLLGEGQAQTATNTKLLRGILQAFNAPSTTLATTSGIDTIHKYGTKWLTWTNPVSVVTNLVPGDTGGRVFWTGDGSGYPQQSNTTLLAIGGADYVTDTANKYRLGVPAPDSAPAVTISGDAPDEFTETRTYVYAWVHKATIGGMSTPFSQAVGKGQAANITGMSVDPPTTYPTVGGHTCPTSGIHWRKFLFLQDSSTSQYILIAKLAYDVAEYTDTGVRLKRRVKSSAFNSANIAAPAATPGTSAVEMPADATSTRDYIYCWLYSVSGTNYRSSSSTNATISAEDKDIVYLTALDASAPASFPAGATYIKKGIFRKDGNGDYRLVGKTAKTSTVFIDRKKNKKLGKKLTAWTAGISGAITAPTLAIKTDEESSEVNKVTRFYRQTWVTTWGEESAPGEASDQIDVLPWQLVDVTTSTSAPSGYSNVTLKRIYRTDLLGDYRLAQELALATATWTDDVTDDQLAEQDELVTTDWDTPPAGLSGIVALPNGVIGGYVANEVMFSEPGYPYAFPEAYQYPVDYSIVALGVTPSGVAVLTEGTPYICPGSDPAAMKPEKIDKMYACVAARSVVDMGDFIIYASPEGLVGVPGLSADLLTRDIITPDQWAAYTPSSIKAYRWQDKYLAFYDTGSVQGGILFDPQDPALVFFSYNPTAGYTDPLTGYLYLQIGTNIQRWDAGSALTFTWKSRRVLLDTAICPAAARVDASSYPVTFKLYADGSLKHTQTVASSRPFRLPAGYRASAFEVQMEGTVDVRRVTIATSMGELANG
jgi:hypothetical protein